MNWLVQIVVYLVAILVIFWLGKNYGVKHHTDIKTKRLERSKKFTEFRHKVFGWMFGVETAESAGNGKAKNGGKAKKTTANGNGVLNSTVFWCIFVVCLAAIIIAVIIK